jgi:hypothetical protein
VRPVPRVTVDRLVVNSDGLAHGLNEDGGVASSELLNARFGLPDVSGSQGWGGDHQYDKRRSPGEAQPSRPE